jgi:hypothetical protein
VNEYRQRAATSEEQAAPAGPATREIPAYMMLAAQYGIADEMGFSDSGILEQSIEQECKTYITAPLSPQNVNIIKFWEVIAEFDFVIFIDEILQVNGAAFPTLFQMAMDYLPIQASSVPCEHIFLFSAETNTKKRNCISLLLMEALQMLKFHLKKDRLNFMQDWLTKEDQMTEDESDKEDLLHKLVEVDSQDDVDHKSITHHDD